MNTTGFLQINDPDGGQCVVLVDNYMTAQIVKNSPSRWEVINECQDCACAEHSCGVEDVTDAPWYDANRPASAEFFGLYGTLSIAQPPAAAGGIAGETVAPLKTLTFVGLLAASSARGAAFGKDWVDRALQPLCRPCESRTAEVGLFCPCEDETIVDQGEPVPRDWSTVVGIDGCDDPEPLGETPAAIAPTDNGLRTVLEVNYNNGSFVELPSGGIFPNCYGLRVTFSFTLGVGEAMTDVLHTCIMEGPNEGDPTPCCTAVTFDLEPEADDCGCPTPCECVQPSGAPSIEGSPSPRINYGGQDCTYSTPMCAQTFACLTPALSPQGLRSRIRIEAGETELRDVAVLVWEAVPGLPDPTTPRGLELYLERETIGVPALISRIPAGSTAVIDGAAERDYLECPGISDRQGTPVTACGGRSFRHAELCCGRRFWFALELPCGAPTDWRMTVELVALDRI